MKLKEQEFKSIVHKMDEEYKKDKKEKELNKKRSTTLSPNNVKKNSNKGKDKILEQSKNIVRIENEETIFE